MNNNIKIVLAIALIGVAVFAGLWFGGVVSFGEKDNISHDDINDNQSKSSQEIDTEIDYWEIIYDGIKITPDISCDALIDDKNTLCFSVTDMWELEVVLADKGYEEHKNDIATRESNLEESGYQIEQTATTVDIGAKEYLYIGICGEIITELGDVDERHMIIISANAPDGRRFEIFVNSSQVTLEGKAFSNLNEEERCLLYEEAVRITDLLIGDSTVSDKANDTIGTAWYKEEMVASNGMEYVGQDTLIDDEGNVAATYMLPQDTEFNYEPESTKKSAEKWYDISEDISLVISVDYSYNYSNAYEYIEFSAKLEDKRVYEIYELDAGGHHWYYYWYNTAVVSNDETKLTYQFCAATDLGDGRIFRLHSESDKESVCDVETYMNIMESLKP